MIPYTRQEGNQIIHYSPWPRSDQNYFKGNLAELVINSPHLKQHPEQPVYIDSHDANNRILAKEVAPLVKRVAYILKSRYGIGYDDTVCVFAKNSIRWPIIAHGIFATGGVMSPANIAYTPRELAHQLDISQSKLIITTKELWETAQSSRTVSGDYKVVVENVILLDDLFEDAKASSEEMEPIKLTPEEAVKKPVCYCFSSGTSGSPKGVISTHYNLSSNLEQQVSVTEMYNPSNTFGCFLPLSHMYGLSIFVLTTPYSAVTTIVFPKFDFEFLLQKIQEYKISFLHIVPPVAVLLAKSPLVDKYPGVTKYLEKLFSGAAPLSKELADTMTSRINCKLFQGYGLTETSPQSHVFTWNEETYDISGIGWLVPNMEARLVTEDGHDVTTINTPGEIYMRGPNVFPGYLRNKESTNSSFEGNWFKTGDVGQVNEHGNWKIVDRVKELIKSHGFQVAPAELEGLLLEHPNVADVAVTALNVIEEGTEYPRAFIVLKEEGNPLDILEWINGRVAKHKRLYGGIIIVNEIPKSPSGKILRRLLRDIEFDKVYGFPQNKNKL